MTEPGRSAFRNVHPDYDACLRDESRKAGNAEAIAFPESEDEVARALEESAACAALVTIQGGRTGITAGAVPAGGRILNLSRLNRIAGFRMDGEAGRLFVSAQPGVLLQDLRTAVVGQRACPGEWFFPPDPTETTASLGGMVACNASGALTFHYGPMRRYVHALRVVLADGRVLVLKRGAHQAKGREFRLVCDAGSEIRGRVPTYVMPGVKNAAGYFAAENMDLLDLFIGSEGTLGVITEIECELLTAPPVRWAVMAFLPSERSATTFVRRVRGDPVELGAAVVRNRPVAVEFFDARSLELLRRKRSEYAVLAELPEVPPGTHTAVYVEYHGASEDALAAAVEPLAEIIETCGGDEGATWTATDDAEMRRLKDFRHAVPETVNLVIDERRRSEPQLTKLGTDMAVPDAHLEHVMSMYHDAMAASGLEYVVFGHIGNNHVHVNILPNSMDEYEKGRGIYLDWARQVIRMGGTISAEHGVGKLKTALLKEMYGEKGIEEMKAVKSVFDPGWMLNRGNLF